MARSISVTPDGEKKVKVDVTGAEKVNVDQELLCFREAPPQRHPNILEKNGSDQQGSPGGVLEIEEMRETGEVEIQRAVKS